MRTKRQLAVVSLARNEIQLLRFFKTIGNEMEFGIRWNRFDTDAENWVGLKFSQIAMKKRSSQKDIIWGGGMSTSWWSSHHHPSHHNSSLLPKNCLQLCLRVDWVIIGHTICRHLLLGGKITQTKKMHKLLRWLNSLLIPRDPHGQQWSHFERERCPWVKPPHLAFGK